MTVFYGIVLFFLWFLSGVLGGLIALELESRTLAHHKFMRYDVRRSAYSNWVYVAILSVGGPVFWSLLALAAWRGWI